ncbi:hypothetical protein KBC54_03225 [Patescibacteria group bacterium]|nr:hypothetical protein [Patescibacteria group bacterium]
MKKILYSIFLGFVVVFPYSAHAEDCLGAIGDDKGTFKDVSCVANNDVSSCSGYLKGINASLSCPAGSSCCVTYSDSPKTKTDQSESAAASSQPKAEAGTVESACNCSFSIAPSTLMGIAAAGAGFSGQGVQALNLQISCATVQTQLGDGGSCQCGLESGKCTKQFLASKEDCETATAEAYKTQINLIPGVSVTSGKCTSALSTAPKKAVKAKACVPKAVAKAGLGQLDMSGVSSCCISNGDCTLDDIVTTGASFANLLTQLSAAFFFATFVYGGAMYLLSFGDKGRVDKGKKAITGAAVGMLIVLMAWTIVNYIANALKAKV